MICTAFLVEEDVIEIVCTNDKRIVEYGFYFSVRFIVLKFVRIECFGFSYLSRLGVSLPPDARPYKLTRFVLIKN